MKWDVCLAGGEAWRAAARQRMAEGTLFAGEDAGGEAAAWNALAAQGGGDWIVFCRGGALPRPDAARALLEAARSAPDGVAALAMRALPLENPKFYHPLTLETDALDGACFAVRRAAFEAAGGFATGSPDPVAALSGALHAAGGTICVVPRAVVETDAEPRVPDGAFCRICPPMIPEPPHGIHFTVLVRAWKRPEMLDRALACLEHQTYRDFDVVVAEDGAQPVCADVVERHRGALDITYVPLGRDAGRSSAANAAMEAARGPWLAFLDDDDYFFPDHLEAAAHLLSGAPDCRIAALGSVEAAARSGAERYDTSALRLCPAEKFSLVRQCAENAFPIQAVMFRRELFAQYGGMDEALDALEDWDLWTRYFLHARPALCARTTSLFHTPEDFFERKDRIERMDAWKSELVEKWKGYRIETTASDLLEALWEPGRQAEACECARSLRAQRDRVREMQNCRRRQATRPLRRALNAVARALVRVAGPEDVDVDSADTRTLLEQADAIGRSLILR